MKASTIDKTILWFKIYCGILALLYLLMIPMGLLFFILHPHTLAMSQMEARITGAIFIIFSVPFFIAAALPFLLKRRPWVWIYDLVIICLGLTSCCFWPIAIPLLIYWIKPEMKEYFSKNSEGAEADE